MKTTFERLPSTEVTVLIVLRKLDNGEELWESREAPPQLQGMVAGLNTIRVFHRFTDNDRLHKPTRD